MAQSNEHTTVEMNRTICEFMGWKFKQDGDDWFNAYHEGQLMWADDGKFVNKVLVVGFNYHEDWNKLMPVVEKVTDTHNQYTYFQQGELYDELKDAVYSANIIAVHTAVYQFIIWFNQQKQKNGNENI